MGPTPFDSLVIRCLAEEVAAAAGEKVGRIGVPDRLSLSLGLRGSALVLSVDPELPALCLVPELPPQPGPVSSFARLVAARLEGSLFQGALTVPGERVVSLTFERPSRLFDPETFRLVAEFFGTRGDLVLTDAAFTVLGTLRGLRAEPGDAYILPPPTVDAEVPGPGAPPLLARELSHLALDDGAARDLWRALWATPARFSPVAAAGISPPAYPLPLTHLPAAGTPIPSLMEVLAGDWWTRHRRREEERGRQKLRDHYAAALARAHRKLLQQEAELREADDARRYRIWGEALLSLLRDVRPGTEEVPYTDWETGETGVIPLPPGLTPAEAAQKYFATYKRLVSRQKRLSGELARTREAVADAESHLSALEAAGDPVTPSDLASLEGAAPAGPSRPTRGMLPGREFRTTTGRRMRVGRSAADNELLWRSAASRDIWLHAKDIAGSHVILSTEGGIGEREIEEAALLAAHFSKARHSAHVAVDWTLRRHVRKPKGSAPGFVLYDHETTVFVDPTSPLVETLIRTERTARS